MKTARKVVREADSSVWFRLAARAGFAANGILHLAIGTIIAIVAAGGDAESDQTGAFRAIASVPLGFAALWAIAIALWALAAWHLLQAVLARGDGLERWGRVASEIGQMLAFTAIGIVAAIVASGAKPDAEQAAEGASRGILAVPGGPFLLGAIGAGVGIAGISFVVMGVRRSFRTKVRIPEGAGGVALTILGVVGFVAKGAALIVVGVLLVIAAITLEPTTAGGLDGAVQALQAMTAGPALAWVVGLGFVSYGLFTLARAHFAKLDA